MSDHALSGIAKNPARRLDSALAKLLNELSIGDPDERELAEVLVACCQGRAGVPVGVETEIELGTWLGRTTPLAKVQLMARSLTTGEEITGRFDDVGDALIRQEMYIGLLVVIG